MKGAHISIVYLDPQPSGAKMGLDDYFAAGGDVAGLLARAEADVRPTLRGDDESGPYVATPAGFVHRTGSGEQPLSNFTARIVEEVTADDGASQRAELVISGELGDEPLPPLRVPPRRFHSGDWVSDWGARAIVSAGMGTRDKVREAIQRHSLDITRRHVYEHSGWRELPGAGWCYLHAGGAIGAAGPIADVDVALREPAGLLRLPDPPSGDDLRVAVRACLALRDVAPDRITAPLFGSVYRAILSAVAPADLSLFPVGRTGVYKTELSALAMQHVGAGFDRLNLPAQWSSTANALERLTFDFKDAPLVIDDFAPHGTQHDVARLHATAERVLRGAGNRRGRSRMNADGTLRPDFPPRGLIIGTGEDAPRGYSLRARLVLIDVAPGDVDLKRLTNAQAAGRAGTFAAATAGFVQWLAPHIDALRSRLPALLAEFRTWAHDEAAHARTPDAVAQLAAGWWAFLHYAAAVAALSEAEAEAAFHRAWAALGETAARQRDYQREEEPAQRFLELLSSALAAGHLHLASTQGGVPLLPAEAWGWREERAGGGEYERREWRPQGSRAGWVDGDDLYLDLEAALAGIQRVAQASGHGVAIGPKALAKRLHEGGYLRSTEKVQGALKVRRVIEGRRARVLHLSAEVISAEESGQSGQSGHEETHPAARRGARMRNARISWPDFLPSDHESGQKIRPDAAQPRDDVRIGRIGQMFTTRAATEGDSEMPSPSEAPREGDSEANAPADCPRPWECGTAGPCPGYGERGCPLPPRASAGQSEGEAWRATPLVGVGGQ